jgi:ABC-type amino acid transport system permease subunit
LRCWYEKNWCGLRLSVILSRLVLLSILLAAVLVNLFSLEKIEDFLKAIPYRCPLRWVTGWKCAFCGMTHSWISIFRGDLSTAYQENILGIPLLIITIFFLIIYSLKKKMTINLKAFIAVCLAFMIVYAIVRNIN